MIYQSYITYIMYVCLSKQCTIIQIVEISYVHCFKNPFICPYERVQGYLEKCHVFMPCIDFCHMRKIITNNAITCHHIIFIYLRTLKYYDTLSCQLVSMMIPASTMNTFSKWSPVGYYPVSTRYHLVTTTTSWLLVGNRLSQQDVRQYLVVTTFTGRILVGTETI